MKIKVNEATELQLDWMVATAENLQTSFGDWHQPDEGCQLRVGKTFPSTGARLFWIGGDLYSPTEIWNQAGPIIERESISVIRLEDDYGIDKRGFCNNKRIPVFGAVIGDWFATTEDRDSYGDSHGEIYYVPVGQVVSGPTPLIAAMRCYVVSKLGDEVEVPDSLS